MDAEITVNLLREALSLLMAISLPLLIVGLVVGVLLGLFQAATQVQEAALSFVPKLLAIAFTFWLAAPWMADKVLRFVRLVFEQAVQVGTSGGVGV
jgi:flagellar biosynthetic protein FliQ